MKNFINVKFLNKEKIKELFTHNPGVYKWWFDEQSTEFLLSRLLITNTDKIQQKIINDKIYYALYIGISDDLYERICWHILQKHKKSNIINNFSSTLRTTLCSLIHINYIDGEFIINDFIANHCYLEWEDKDNPKIIESNELQNDIYYYPLNIKENKSLSIKTKKLLKKLRKFYKK